MKLPMLVLLSAGLMLAAGAPAEDAAKKDLDKLQGSWTVQSGEFDGQKAPEDKLKEMKLLIKGDKIAFKTGDQAEEETYQLDPGKNPKMIDIQITRGAGKGMALEGIYQLDGDDLKLCLCEPGGARPKEFSAKAGSKQILFVLKREKP